METPKSEIQVNWTAPESGAGDLSFRATIIENRDVWYMDGIFLTADLQEDLDAQDKIVSEVLEECCACNEARYEVWMHFAIRLDQHPPQMIDVYIFSCRLKAYGRSIRIPKISPTMFTWRDLAILLGQHIKLEAGNEPSQLF